MCISDSEDSDDTLHHVAGSDDHSPTPTMRFASHHKGSTAASGKLSPPLSLPPTPIMPSPPMPSLPLTPPPLLTAWKGNACVTSGGEDGGDELSSCEEDDEEPSTGSRGSSTPPVGATISGDDAKGHPQKKHSTLHAGLPPSARDVAPPTVSPNENNSSSNQGKALPLALRKYAKKWDVARGSVATVVSPAPVPRTPELGVESVATADAAAASAAGEDRPLPWISTAVAAARSMTRATTAVPATIATAAAARFRSHWG